MAIHNELGKRGEALARQHLEAKGYRIIAVNWRAGRTEVDFIAHLGELVIFVEVKTRSGTAFGLPEEFVDARKQHRLATLAGRYVDDTGHQGEVRFDIVAILISGQGEPHIRHIEDAFFPYEF